jgi:hypothetical protein
MMLGAILLAATAGSACGAPDAVFARLHDRYGEVPVFAGQDQGGRSVIMTLSKRGTWSVVVVGDAAGVLTACVAEAGDRAMVAIPGVKT